MKTLTYFIFSFLICSAQIGLGQNEKISDLLQQLDEAKNDSLRCEIFIEISDFYVRQNQDSAWLYLEKSYEIAEKNLEKNLWAQINIGDILRNKGNLYYYSNKFTEAINYYTQAAESYKKNIDHEDAIIAEKMSNALAKLYVNMGVTYTNLGSFDLAMQKYYDALAVYERINDVSGMANCYLGMANLEYYQREFDNAITTLKKGSELYEQIGNKGGMANCYNTIGSIHFLNKEFNLAIDYFNKVLNLRTEMEDLKGISTAYTNLANVYIEVSNFTLAIDYLNKALAIDESLGDTYSVAIVQINIARLYDKMATTLNIDPQSRRNYFEKAHGYSQKAYKIARSMEVLPLVNYIADVLSKVNRSLGNYDEANYFYEVFTQTQDSLTNEEKTKAIAEMQTRYETEKKQQEIDFLNAESRRQRIITYTILTGFIVVLILSSFLYSLLMHKRRANALLAEQKQQIVIQNATLQQANEEILAQRDEITAQRDLVINQKQKLEEVNNHMTNSLRYAQSIQSAILPSEKIIRQISSDFFIFMKPCELVSGDFFWATTFNEFQIFCVADCTGHGVPGAFMSILGITALNDIVSNHRVTKANEVLGYLRSSVIETLSQNDPGHLHKDGMDIGLCIFNTKTQELQFSGAKIPLWLVVKTSDKIDWGNSKVNDSIVRNGFSLTEIKGDIMPVGTSPRMEPFFNNSITINSNAVTLYLATDGFADQFGGEKRTKFGANRLKNHLLEIEQLSASQKKQSIEKVFEEWKGKENQIDDTVILGISI